MLWGLYFYIVKLDFNGKNIERKKWKADDFGHTHSARGITTTIESGMSILPATIISKSCMKAKAKKEEEKWDNGECC